MNNTAIIILAAGSSSRLGVMKQLLHLHNKTLLQHVIDEAIESGGDLIVTVTGANADKVLKEINPERVKIVFNEKWEEGMASSIVAGVHAAITYNHSVENIIIAVCDQPFISSSLFKQLYQIHQEGTKHIVASAYADTIGTPALFNRKYFDPLMSLTGDEGAKKLLKTYRNDVATVEFSHGNIDIDTQEDYENFNKNFKAGLMI
jgi:molybdenum cofactor cytidylyltransferase